MRIPTEPRLTFFRSRRRLGWITLGICLLANFVCVPGLRAACNFSNGFTAGISELTLNYNPHGNCGTLTGYLVFWPKPTLSPTSGDAYSLGQLYGGSTVVATSNTTSVLIENGPYATVTPGTAYPQAALSQYSLYGYDSSHSYLTDDYWGGAVTTGPGGGRTKLWSYKMEYASLAAPALTPGGEVVASGNDYILHSMKASNGARMYQPGSTTGAPGYVGGAVQSTSVVVPSQYLAAVDSTKCASCDVVFVGAQDGKVRAFNAQTGQVLWESPLLTNGSINGAPVVQLRYYGNAAFRNAYPNFDIVIVGTHNAGDRTGNKIYALRSDTGEIYKTFAPGNLDQINSTPAFDYGTNTVWVTSNSNNGSQPSLWQLDTTTWQPLASLSLSTSNKDVDCSPKLNFNAAHPYLYFVTNGGELVAVNTQTKAIVQAPGIGSGSVKLPIVLRNSSGGDDIYFSSAAGVSKFSFDYANLTRQWVSSVVPSPSKPVPNNFAAATAIYVGGSDGALYKLNTSNGQKADSLVLNSVKLIGDANIDPLSSTIYVGDSDGRIYAFNSF